jgi:hypothetical protein
MNQILSNNEIAQVVHDIDCAEVRPFDIEFARVIEQAILHKLSEQNKSVVFYLCEGCGHYYQTPVTSCDCMADLPLIVTTFFTRPSPSVPKGWTAIHATALELPG